MKESTHAEEENTQAEVHMVVPPLRLVLLTQFVQRGGGKKKYMFVSLHVWLPSSEHSLCQLASH